MTNAIPKELRDRHQWVRWRKELRSGAKKPTKVPYQAVRAVKASSTNPITWGAYLEAEKNRDRHNMDGIGFAFADDPFAGVDLDHCRNPETGAIDSWARQWVARLDSYTELSPSGDGLHIIVRAKKPGSKCRKGLGNGGEVEVYDRGRYFTMTGEHLADTPSTINDRQDVIEQLYREVLDPPKSSRARKPAQQKKQTTSNDDALDDDALIELMCAKNDKAARLWEGDSSGHASMSEAVFALCCHLAFWTDHDESRMDNLFRQSGLCRDHWAGEKGKWGRLGGREIKRACEKTKDGYTPPAAAGGGQGESGPPWNDVPPPTDDDAPNSSNSGNSSSAKAETRPWPEPEPLRRELPLGDLYPLDVFPQVLRGAADKMIEAIQAPAGIVGSALLGAASLAVHGHANVVIDGRTMPTSLDLLTVADSGERKSGVDNAALAPHRKRQKDLIRNFESEMESFEAEHSAWKKAHDEALRKGKGVMVKREALEDLGPAPLAPIEPLLLCAEPTYEGIVKQLAHGWPSVGLFSSEGGRFLGGHAWSKDHQIKTATGLSELWDGTEIDRLRGGDGSLLLYGRRVALHIMIQPSLLPLLFGDAMLAGQGFLARLLLAFPTSTISTRPYREVDLPQTPEMRRYFGHMMNILEASLPMAEGQRNELQPRRLELARGAKQTWIDYYNHTEALQAPGGELYCVRAAASKTAEQAARIAGVLALVEDLGAASIKAEHMEAGIELAQYYLGETLRLHLASKDDPDLDLAENVLEWARSRGGRFAAVDLYQLGPSAIRNKATATRIMSITLLHPSPYRKQVKPLFSVV